jgi:hypothetical protein
VESGRIGKQHSTTWNCERTGETARLGAHEALPQTPPGGTPHKRLLKIKYVVFCVCAWILRVAERCSSTPEESLKGPQ